MDTYDYSANCYKAFSMEIAFNADDTAYLGYIQAVFELIQKFGSQKVLVGAYISLRYCAGSEALLAIEQWPHTVCIEISALGGLAQNVEVLAAFEREAADRGATVHWGQLNNRTRADIEARFRGKIDRWRAILARTASKGSSGTFDNDFCRQRGLEIYSTKIKRDLPFLLSDPLRHVPDISYVVPLL